MDAEQMKENPTYVGMDRQNVNFVEILFTKTPRMWGWTDCPCRAVPRSTENPTYVGMDRKKI